MNKRIGSLTTLALLATLGAAACGSDPQPAAPAPVPTVAPATTALAPTTTTAATTTTLASTTTLVPTTVTPATGTPAAGQSIVVKIGESRFGKILVDASGNSLYAFLNDNDAQSSCTGTCADAWPPVVVDEDWTVAPGVDSGVFSTIIRPDGSEQLAAGQFPLYRFSGDTKAGDTNGQGSGSVWFLVDSEARAVPADHLVAPDVPTEPEATVATVPAVATTLPAPVTTVAASPVTVVDNALGQILAGPSGNTVYGLTKDVDGLPTCAGGCATAWPPVIVDGTFDITAAPASLNLSIVDRADGTKQLKAGKWPLYYFAGDAAPGETNGQGSGTTWFVLGADTKLVK